MVLSLDGRTLVDLPKTMGSFEPDRTRKDNSLGIQPPEGEAWICVARMPPSGFYYDQGVPIVNVDRSGVHCE